MPPGSFFLPSQPFSPVARMKNIVICCIFNIFQIVPCFEPLIPADDDNTYCCESGSYNHAYSCSERSLHYFSTVLSWTVKGISELSRRMPLQYPWQYYRDVQIGSACLFYNRMETKTVFLILYLEESSVPEDGLDNQIKMIKMLYSLGAKWHFWP